MFWGLFILGVSVGAMTIRNKIAFNIYLAVVILMGLFFLVSGLSNLFFGRL